MPRSSRGARRSSTEYTPHSGMATSIHRSPRWNSRWRRLASSPRETMISTPANEISMPAICLRDAFSRSRIQEHASMKSGPAALMSTALIALVVRSPRYTRVWNAATPVSASTTKSPAWRRMIARCPSASPSPSGAMTSAATSQRQKLSATGSNDSRTARPITQLPDHRRFASTSRAKAPRRRVSIRTPRAPRPTAPRPCRRPRAR